MVLKPCVLLAASITADVPSCCTRTHETVFANQYAGATHTLRRVRVGCGKPITSAHPHFLIHARISVEKELYNALVCAAHSLVQRGAARLRDPPTPGPNAVKWGEESLGSVRV